jgi:hypothetical protein
MAGWHMSRTAAISVVGANYGLVDSFMDKQICFRLKHVWGLVAQRAELDLTASGQGLRFGHGKPMAGRSRVKLTYK